MPVRYVEGDLFLSNAQTLAHGCNCAGRMGAGIAVQFKRRFPEMFKEFKKRCREGTFTPGSYYLEKNTTPWVLNLATQAALRGATLAYVERCLERVAANYEEEGIVNIAMPRIGAGLGGLDWTDVRAALDEILDPIPIPIDVYAEYIAGVEVRI